MVYLAVVRRIVSIILMTLCLWGCSSLAGNIRNGVYISANGEFMVKTPSIPGLGVRDGNLLTKSFVDFYTGPGYWTPYGLYSVEWYKQVPVYGSDRSFFITTKNKLEKYIKNNFVSRATFSLVDTRRLKVNGKPAFQFIARGKLDNIRAIWMGTYINLEERIAVCSLIFKDRSLNSQDLVPFKQSGYAPWEKYNDFIHSIKRLK